MMEALDQHGYGEDAEITDVFLIVAVEHDTEGQARATHLHWTPSPGMAALHVGMGLLTQVRQPSCWASKLARIAEVYEVHTVSDIDATKLKG